MTDIKYDEWVENNSLTSKADMDNTKCYKSRVGLLPLKDKELEAEAIDALNIKDGVHKFPMIDSRYTDPELCDQLIGLYSFVPAKGAIPNKDGWYGMIKLRGNYESEMKANIRADYLIKNYDTYHKIYHIKVGMPMPLTINPQYVKDTAEIKVKDLISENISADIKKNRQDEAEQMKIIKERERKLLEDNKRREELHKEGKEEEEAPIDKYTTLRVKRAQLIHTYLRTRDSLAKVKDLIIKTRKEYDSMHSENPQLKDEFLQKYMEARKESGLSVPTDLKEDASFLQFLAEDKVKELDFDE